jgi:hypothetical protein
MKLHCRNGLSQLGHRPSQLWWPSPWGLSARGRDRGTPKRLNSSANSGEHWRGEVVPWVGEMACEVGDLIWSPVKEEGHQRAVSTGGGLGRIGTAVRGTSDGGGRWLAVREGVGTRVVIGVASMGRVGGRRRLGGARWWQGKASVVEEWEWVRWREESEWEGTPPRQPRPKG